MGTIIAVVSGKGGTGKTSFTASVGIALAEMGYRTLALDCDITLRNLDMALGLSDSTTMDFSDVLAGRCSLDEAVAQHRKYTKLELLAAPLSGHNEGFDVDRMKALGREIREKYDFCLVDAPAGLGHGFLLATAIADRAVVITTADPTALRDAQRAVSELACRVDELHLVMNRVQPKLMGKLRTSIDYAMDTAGLPLLGVVPEDPSVMAAAVTGVPLILMTYKGAAPAYLNIARRLLGQRVPLLRIR